MFKVGGLSQESISWFYDLSTPRWNLILSGAHLLTALFIFLQWLLPDFWEVRSDIKLNVLKHQYELNNNTLEEIGQVPIFLLIFIFETITAVFHFVYFLSGQLSGALRYVEYSFSAPIMIVIIALLLGLQEIFVLVALAFLTHVTMVFGYIQDLKATDTRLVLYLTFIYTFLYSVLCGAYLATNRFNFTLQFNTNFCFLRVQVDTNTTRGMDFDLVVEQETNKVALTILLLAATTLFAISLLLKNGMKNDFLKYLALALFTIVALAAFGVAEAYFLSLLSTVPITLVNLYNIRGWDPQYETLSTGVEKIRPYLNGFVPFTATWVVLILYYAVSVIINDAKPPWFVHVVVITEFVLFSSFVLPQFFYGGINGDAIDENKKEGLFNFLSLTSKLSLSWFVYGGIKAAS